MTPQADWVKEDWQKIFLDAGTANGFGDLSGMIATVNYILLLAQQRTEKKWRDKIERLEKRKVFFDMGGNNHEVEVVKLSDLLTELEEV